LTSWIGEGLGAIEVLLRIKFFVYKKKTPPFFENLAVLHPNRI